MYTYARVCVRVCVFKVKEKQRSRVVSVWAGTGAVGSMEFTVFSKWFSDFAQPFQQIPPALGSSGNKNSTVF